MTKLLHTTWRLSLMVLLLSISNGASAWKGMRMPELFVKGRYLMAKDINGNDSIVNLHGFGQTYSAYFNGYAWCKNADGSVNWGKTKDAAACVKWNKEQIRKMLDGGWKVNWLRLHMDPAWSNNETKVNQWQSQHPGTYYSENLIVAFDMNLFKKYLDEIFIPMAEYAIENGIYVVMRPPGVCPQKLTVGDEYQQYLIKVWTYVCNHEKLKNNPYVMFELANEPIDMNDGNGNYTSWSDGSQKNCTKFFQQIVDEIRAVGCNNILWVPGLAYQQNYQGYVKYPITGENIGFAVHCYPGWYGSDSEVASAEQQIVTNGNTYADFQSGWSASIDGISKLRPILVTEMDWAPKKYNSSWGKATTGKLGGVGFGNNFKYIMDKTGNVSWMLFTDADKLANYDDSRADGSTFLTDPEACPRPVYRWYKEYAEPGWKFVETLADEFYMFPGTNSIFSPNIWEKGTLTKNDDGSRTLVTGQYGFGGWKFGGGLDMSEYKYLVLNLAAVPSSNQWSLRLFDVDNYWTDPYMKDVKSSTRVVVDLQNMKNSKGAKVDPSHIYILGLWSTGGTPIKIKDIYLTNNSDYSPETTGINESLAEMRLNTPIYNLSGQRITEPRNGQVYIKNGKKYIHK
mgnify:CR=1 FL=1